MATLITILTFGIVLFGFLNLVRLTIFMVAADIYDIKQHQRRKSQRGNPVTATPPFISVLIPAHNEEVSIARTLNSVLQSRFPRFETIVIDDGSTDSTASIVRRIQKLGSKHELTLLRQANAGKGAALNNGISHAKGELIMVLDADSTIAPDALANCVKYFQDPSVKAIASSVKLLDNGSWLGLIQKVEYLLAYRMKRSLTALNIEYIIGGVGSVYRASILRQVAGYRENTITEDIDLSMKVVARGNHAYRVVFASDVFTTTEPVHDLAGLIRQRYRWKAGRLQAFVRYRNMFFSKNRKYNKLLTWLQLPYAIFGEIYLVLEPLFILLIVAMAYIYKDASAIILAAVILCSFMIFNVIAEKNETWKTKLALIYLMPAVYLLLPILSYVELSSLIKSVRNWRELSPNTKKEGSWEHVARKPDAAAS